MTDADFIAAIVERAPELTDQQIAGLRDLIAPVPVDASTIPVAPYSSPAMHRASTRPRAITASPDVAAQAA